MPKLPSFQFYPGDWLKDPALRAVSSAARGLWIDLCCYLWESLWRGYLIHPNGEPVTDEQIARMTGNSVEDTKSLIQELEKCGVSSRTERNILYCRRIVRDEEKRQKCSEAGKRGGGNPAFKGSSKGEAKGEAKGEVKGEAKGSSKRNANPSSSSSSSSSPSTSMYEETPPLYSPNGQPPDKRRAMADRIIEAFRRASGKDARATAKRIAAITARLKEIDDDVEGAVKAVERMADVWRDNPEMRQYITIETLFRPSNFLKYYESRNEPIPVKRVIPDHEANPEF